MRPVATLLSSQKKLHLKHMDKGKVGTYRHGFDNAASREEIGLLDPLATEELTLHTSARFDLVSS